MSFLEITSKDLRLLVRDRRTLALLLALPILFIWIIGLTTGQMNGWNDNNKLLRIAMVDLIDYGKLEASDARGTDLLGEQTLARNTFAKLFNRVQKRDGMDVLEVASPDRARTMYQEADVNVAVLVGPEFYSRVRALAPEDIMDPSKGKLADGLAALDIQVQSDYPEGSTHAIVEQLVYADVLRTIALYPLCDTPIFERRIRTTCRELTEEAAKPPIALRDPLPPKQTQGSAIYQELIPSYTVMFVFFLVNIMARSFIHERQLGTLRRLRISPVSPTGLLIGKTLPFLVVSVVQTLLLFVFGRLLFGMSWGEQPLWLLPVGFCTSMAATSLGLLVATLVRTDSQVSAYANMTVILMAGISGCLMPRDWLPPTMQDVSLATPHAWALIAYDQLLHTGTANLGTVMECCASLLAFSVLFFVLGSLRFGSVD